MPDEHELMCSIYGRKVGTPGNLPYRIFCDGVGESYGLAGVSHWPGKDGQKSETMPTHEKMWGFVGLLVEDYRRPVQSQKLQLAWRGIDIDGSDNSDMALETLIQTVIPLFEHTAVVRTSKSGTGLHLLFPYKAPTPGTYMALKQMAKHDCIPAITTLIKHNIAPCVFGLVNMWLFSEGGKQRTLHVPEWARS